MSVIDTIILTSCVGLSGMQHDACEKALTAGSKQSGIEANVDKTESNMTKIAEKDAKEYLGDNTVKVVAGTAVVAKTLVDKAATIKLPTLGMCTSVVLKVGQEKSVLNLEWKF